MNTSIDHSYDQSAGTRWRLDPTSSPIAGAGRGTGAPAACPRPPRTGGQTDAHDRLGRAQRDDLVLLTAQCEGSDQRESRRTSVRVARPSSIGAPPRRSTSGCARAGWREPS